MYIITIVDTYPDGNGTQSTPKITLVDSINFVRDSLRSKFKATDDPDKKNVISDVIQQTTGGNLSGGVFDGKYSIGFDIVDRDVFEEKKQEEIEKTQNKIKKLEAFIAECKQRLKELDSNV